MNGALQATYKSMADFFLAKTMSRSGARCARAEKQKMKIKTNITALNNDFQSTMTLVPTLHRPLGFNVDFEVATPLAGHVASRKEMLQRLRHCQLNPRSCLVQEPLVVGLVVVRHTFKRRNENPTVVIQREVVILASPVPSCCCLY